MRLVILEIVCLSYTTMLMLWNLQRMAKINGIVNNILKGEKVK